MVVVGREADEPVGCRLQRSEHVAIEQLDCRTPQKRSILPFVHGELIWFRI